MIRFEPVLFLNRLVISSKGAVAYDERFHFGVNIICGEDNSVGKSTIINFIFYALGGEDVVFTAAALECDEVCAEIEINGASITLRREVSKIGERPLKIFWGNYEQAQAGSTADWESYPYAQRGDAVSFSQVLFRAMGIPEVKQELQSRITMYQLLRLMFADQKSPHDELFRHQDWITKDTMGAVGGLLCGYYDDRIHELREELRKHTEESQKIKARLRSLWAVLGEDQDQVAGLQFLESSLGEVKERLQKATESDIDIAGDDSESESDATDVISEEIRELKQNLVAQLEESHALDFEIADSEHFIEVLTSNINAVDVSNGMRNALGSIRFKNCPACLSPIPEPAEDHCELCKSQYDQKADRSRFLHLRQQLYQQLEESRKLQQSRLERREQLRQSIPAIRQQLSSRQHELHQLTESVSSKREEAIAEKYRRIGYLNRQVEDIQQQIDLAKRIESLEARVRQLSVYISRIQTELYRRAAAMQKATEVARNVIVDWIDKILRADTGVQAEFKEPRNISFDFRENSVLVDGENNFSESSMVYLRNAFHLALHLASAHHDFFRYPRLTLFDDLEEGGTTPARTQNFQRLIAKLSQETVAEHQIILTTSMVDPDLLTSNLVVGEYYTTEKPTLKLPSGLRPASSRDANK